MVSTAGERSVICIFGFSAGNIECVDATEALDLDVQQTWSITRVRMAFPVARMRTVRRSLTVKFTLFTINLNVTTE